MYGQLTLTHYSRICHCPGCFISGMCQQLSSVHVRIIFLSSTSAIILRDRISLSMQTQSAGKQHSNTKSVSAKSLVDVISYHQHNHTITEHTQTCLTAEYLAVINRQFTRIIAITLLLLYNLYIEIIYYK